MLKKRGQVMLFMLHPKESYVAFKNVVVQFCLSTQKKTQDTYLSLFYYGNFKTCPKVEKNDITYPHAPILKVNNYQLIDSLFFLSFILFFERQTECEQGRGREGDTESEAVPGSELSAQSPKQVSNSQTVRS